MNYRKNDERIFGIFGTLSNVVVFVAFLMVLIYHFYEGKSQYRDLAIWGLVLSVFFKYQILLLKIYIMEIRISNLMNVGRRPGKLAMGMGNVAILIYSIVFWLAVLGCGLAFLPSGWQPDFDIFMKQL